MIVTLITFNFRLFFSSLTCRNTPPDDHEPEPESGTDQVDFSWIILFSAAQQMCERGRWSRWSRWRLMH